MEESARIAALRMAYALFERKDIDSLLALVTEDVEWPNMVDNSRIRGRDQLRQYWLNLWKVALPHTVPREFIEQGDVIIVAAELQVFDPDGNPLSPTSVGIHRFTFTGNLVARLDVYGSALQAAASTRSKLSSTRVRDWMDSDNRETFG